MKIVVLVFNVLWLSFILGCASSPQKIDKRAPSSSSELDPGNSLIFNKDVLASNRYSSSQYSLNSFWLKLENGMLSEGDPNRRCYLVFSIPPNTELFIPKGTTVDIVENSIPDIGLLQNKRKLLGSHGIHDDSGTSLYFKGYKGSIGHRISFQGSFSCHKVAKYRISPEEEHYDFAGAGGISPDSFKKMVLDPSMGLPLNLHLD